MTELQRDTRALSKAEERRLWLVSQRDYEATERDRYFAADPPDLIKANGHDARCQLLHDILKEMDEGREKIALMTEALGHRVIVALKKAKEEAGLVQKQLPDPALPKMLAAAANDAERDGRNGTARLMRSASEELKRLYAFAEANA